MVRNQGKKGNRYDPQLMSNNKPIPQEYAPLNQLVPKHNQNTRNNVQRSSEFTFVGNKRVSRSPNEHLAQADAVCSSRQSMTMNPLIEENTVSTTKKQPNIHREYIMNHNQENEYYQQQQQQQHQQQEVDQNQVQGFSDQQIEYIEQHQPEEFDDQEMQDNEDSETIILKFNLSQA